MAERVVVWVLFGVVLSMTPLVVVAAIGWEPQSGLDGFMTLVCNEDLLAVALTLGGAAAADLPTNSQPPWRVVKLGVGGITFLTAIVSMGIYVANENPFSPSRFSTDQRRGGIHWRRDDGLCFGMSSSVRR